MALGLYISLPFCRTKCSYCNFVSDVSSRAMFDGYLDRVCADMENSAATAKQMGGRLERDVDSVYLGGGTPSILDCQQLRRLFVTIRQNFCLQPETEITVECAPGTLHPTIVETLVDCRVNRVSLGVQSFVDAEAAAVGRLHKRSTVLADIARLRAAGICNINVDLIAGLPHQTTQSWEFSLAETIRSGAPHASVYMLEVDEDSRLGRELIAGGARYHAHFVPNDDLIADLYLVACDQLESAGMRQYEISNFARQNGQSGHNLKYWTRKPYLGFGVDAHSMLEVSADSYTPVKAAEGIGSTAGGGSAPCEVLAGNVKAVRFATSDSLDQFIAGAPLKRTFLAREAAIEETFFLGLRLTQGVNLHRVAAEFGPDALIAFSVATTECMDAGLVERQGGTIRLTPKGRLLSNEVFERFILTAERLA